MCVTSTPVPVVPSPKLQAYDAIVPSGSLDPEPEKTIETSVCVNWSGPAFAVGAWLPPASVVDDELVVEVLVVVELEVLVEVVDGFVVVVDEVEVVAGADVVEVVEDDVVLVVVDDVEVVVAPVVVVAVPIVSTAVAAAFDHVPASSRTHSVAVKVPVAV